MTFMQTNGWMAIMFVVLGLNVLGAGLRISSIHDYESDSVEEQAS